MSDRRPEPPRAPMPPRHKLALITWVGAYVVITAILALLGPVMAPWPLPLRTLLLSVVMVVAMTWLVIPSLTHLFRGWLVSASPPRRERFAVRRFRAFGWRGQGRRNRRAAGPRAPFAEGAAPGGC